MAPKRLSFEIRLMYDLLPSSANLVGKWEKSDDAACPLCSKRKTLEHVLSPCKIAPVLGQFTWPHNKKWLMWWASLHDTITRSWPMWWTSSLGQLRRYSLSWPMGQFTWPHNKVLTELAHLVNIVRLQEECQNEVCTSGLPESETESTR